MNNNLKVIESIDTIRINENVFINIGLYSNRNNKFYDVVLNLSGKEIFLGRFNKEFNKVTAKYNEGKILICYEDFDNISKSMKISKVLGLYEVVDDTFYSCSEIEALKLFDPNIDSSFIKNRRNQMHRSDIEKVKRLK